MVVIVGGFSMSQQQTMPKARVFFTNFSAVTQRQEVQIKFATSPRHYVLKPDQPFLALT